MRRDLIRRLFSATRLASCQYLRISARCSGVFSQTMSRIGGRVGKAPSS